MIPRPQPFSSALRLSTAAAFSACLGAGGIALIGCDDADSTATSSNRPTQSAADSETADSNESFTSDGTGTEGQITSRSTDATAIDIEKTMPETIVLGKTLTYQVTVSNPSEADLQGVIISEELPEGFEFVSSEPESQISEDGRTLMFPLGEMASGAEQTINITGTPQQAGELTACTTYEFSRGVCTEWMVVNPQLRLVKSVPEMAGLCEPVTFTYVVSNPGDDPATDVTLFDELPEGLLSDGQREITIEIGDIAPRQEVTKSIQVLATEAGTFGSYAAANSDLEAFNSETVRTTFVAPELAVDVRAERPVEFVGKDAMFRVAVTNTGEVASFMTRLRLSVDGDGELSGIDGDTPPIGDDTDYAEGLDLGTLEAGESRSFLVRADAPTSGQMKLVAVAETMCEEREEPLAAATANANVRIESLAAMQIEVVDKTDPVRVGEQTVYEINIINEGSGDDSDLQVSAVLPDGMSYVSGDGTSNVSIEGNQLTMEPVATFAAGQRATWYITVKAEEAAGNTEFIVMAKTKAIPEAVEEEEPTRLY